MDWQTQLGMVGHVALAAVLGGVLGLEREHAHKPAGLRTHMLVSAAACLLMQLGLMLIELARGDGAQTVGDPVRIIQAVVVGISFLGAGTIVHHGGESVRGLTTAGSILLAAALGMTVAVRAYLLAVGVMLLVLLIVGGLSALERRVRPPQPPSGSN